MGIISSTIESRASSVSPRHFAPSLMSMRTNSGERVDEMRALGVSTVFDAVRIISEDVAKLPLKTFQRQPDGAKQPSVTHPLWRLMQKKANPLMTAFDFRQTMTGHVLTFGNAYAEKEFDGAGRLSALWPLNPSRVKPQRTDSGDVEYVITSPDEREPLVLDREQVFHLKGLGFDGLMGYSVVRLAAESIGAAIATDRYAASFFGNDATPSMVLQHPKRLDPEAAQLLRENWNSAYSGSGNARKTAVLEDGMEAKRITIPPNEAQFLETRQFQPYEIARWFRLPPHKLAVMDRATFSNIEQQALEYVTDTLLPWLVRWESQINASLVSDDTPNVFSEHVVDGLLRGDTESRNRAYATARQWGWMSVNEIRARENLNPVEGGEEYLRPANMEVIGEEPEEEPDEDPGGGLDEEDMRAAAQMAALDNRNADPDKVIARLKESHAKILNDAFNRLCKVERDRWDKLDQEKHAGEVRAAIRDVIEGLGVAVALLVDPDQRQEDVRDKMGEHIDRLVADHMAVSISNQDWSARRVAEQSVRYVTETIELAKGENDGNAKR